MSVAQTISEGRGTCERLQVGCVITSPDNRHVLAVGFNGNFSGGPNTCDDPEAKGRCGCLHAEENALLNCDNRVRDKIIYVTHAPCLMCAKRIINSGASRVVYGSMYSYVEGIQILEASGIPTTKMGEV